MKTNSAQSMLQPQTQLGWWSIGLMSVCVVMFLINSLVFMPSDATWKLTFLPIYGVLMLLSGLSAGVVGLVAIVRQHVHSWLAWLAMLFGLWALFMVLGEFLLPH